MSTDDIFVNRFTSLNKVLREVYLYDAQIILEDIHTHDVIGTIYKQCEPSLSCFNKMDNFKSYKDKLFGTSKYTQSQWIDDSKNMLYVSYVIIQ